MEEAKTSQIDDTMSNGSNGVNHVSAENGNQLEFSDNFKGAALKDAEVASGKLEAVLDGNFEASNIDTTECNKNSESNKEISNGLDRFLEHEKEKVIDHPLGSSTDDNIYTESKENQKLAEALGSNGIEKIETDDIPQEKLEPHQGDTLKSDREEVIDQDMESSKDIINAESKKNQNPAEALESNGVENIEANDTPQDEQGACQDGTLKIDKEEVIEQPEELSNDLINAESKENQTPGESLESNGREKTAVSDSPQEDQEPTHGDTLESEKDKVIDNPAESFDDIVAESEQNHTSSETLEIDGVEKIESSNSPNNEQEPDDDNALQSEKDIELSNALINDAENQALCESFESNEVEKIEIDDSPMERQEPSQNDKALEELVIPTPPFVSMVAHMIHTFNDSSEDDMKADVEPLNEGTELELNEETATVSSNKNVIDTKKTEEEAFESTSTLDVEKKVFKEEIDESGTQKQSDTKNTEVEQKIAETSGDTDDVKDLPQHCEPCVVDTELEGASGVEENVGAVETLSVEEDCASITDEKDILEPQKANESVNVTTHETQEVAESSMENRKIENVPVNEDETQEVVVENNVTLSDEEGIDAAVVVTNETKIVVEKNNCENEPTMENEDASLSEKKEVTTEFESVGVSTESEVVSVIEGESEKVEDNTSLNQDTNLEPNKESVSTNTSELAGNETVIVNADIENVTSSDVERSEDTSSVKDEKEDISEPMACKENVDVPETQETIRVDTDNENMTASGIEMTEDSALITKEDILEPKGEEQNVDVHVTETQETAEVDTETEIVTASEIEMTEDSALITKEDILEPKEEEQNVDVHVAETQETAEVDTETEIVTASEMEMTEDSALITKEDILEPKEEEQNIDVHVTETQETAEVDTETEIVTASEMTEDSALITKEDILEPKEEEQNVDIHVTETQETAKVDTETEIVTASEIEMTEDSASIIDEKDILEPQKANESVNVTTPETQEVAESLMENTKIENVPVNEDETHEVVVENSENIDAVDNEISPLNTEIEKQEEKASIINEEGKVEEIELPIEEKNSDEAQEVGKKADSVTKNVETENSVVNEEESSVSDNKNESPIKNKEDKAENFKTHLDDKKVDVETSIEEEHEKNCESVTENIVEVIRETEVKDEIEGVENVDVAEEQSKLAEENIEASVSATKEATNDSEPIIEHSENEISNVSVLEKEDENETALTEEIIKTSMSDTSKAFENIESATEKICEAETTPTDEIEEDNSISKKEEGPKEEAESIPEKNDKEKNSIALEESSSPIESNDPILEYDKTEAESVIEKADDDVIVTGENSTQVTTEIKRIDSDSFDTNKSENLALVEAATETTKNDTEPEAMPVANDEITNNNITSKAEVSNEVIEAGNDHLESLESKVSFPDETAVSNLEKNENENDNFKGAVDETTLDKEAELGKSTEIEPKPENLELESSVKLESDPEILTELQDRALNEKEGGSVEDSTEVIEKLDEPESQEAENQTEKLDEKTPSISSVLDNASTDDKFEFTETDSMPESAVNAKLKAVAETSIDILAPEEVKTLLSLKPTVENSVDAASSNQNDEKTCSIAKESDIENKDDQKIESAKEVTKTESDIEPSSSGLSDGNEEKQVTSNDTAAVIKNVEKEINEPAVKEIKEEIKDIDSKVAPVPCTVDEASKTEDESAIPPPLPVKTGIKEDKSKSKITEAVKLDEPPKPPVRTKGSRAESNSSKDESPINSRHLISHQDSVRQQPTGIFGFFKNLFSCASAKK